MKHEQPCRFPVADIELDGLLSHPSGAVRACVVCHPHPLYGGDRSNSVVAAITRALAEKGAATLRFDFRGVGRSGGRHGGGGPEVHDVLAAVEALASETGLKRIAVAGYSFGSLVALQAALVDGNRADGPRIERVAAVAPPLAMFDASFAASLAQPLFLVAGDRDPYCPRADLEALGASLGANASTVTLESADHFLAGREDEVADHVAAWLVSE